MPESDSDVRLQEILEANHAVRAAYSRVYRCEGTVEAAKGELKAAEKYRDECVAALQDVIDGQRRLPFAAPQDQAEAATDAASVDASSSTPADGGDAQPAGEAWRTVPVSHLELPGKIAEFLAAAELTTLGDIATYTQTHELTDIEGVGPAKAEKIQDAIEAYWRDHPLPESTESEAEEEEASSEADEAEDPGDNLETEDPGDAEVADEGAITADDL